ncbi:MAG: sigma-54 dependent transcriptional regulator, partial [Candidatus Marinimicrobia bacterium]|nr:sigma-54 dependent transcriptional regulator [Candidatus Neomarinimicrobiota bacterium]
KVKKMTQKLLIIDDDKQFIDNLVFFFGDDFQCIYANKADEGITVAKSENPDVILLDLILKDKINGLGVLEKLRDIDDSIPIIMITDYASIDTAVEAIQLGAYDYISKTPNMKELKLTINKSLKQRKLKFYNDTLKEEIGEKYYTIIGQSKIIETVKEKIFLSANNLQSVLITGESGTGKELVARQIHKLSDRKNRAFIPINCSAIPKELIESELFGYEKGAFTGADKRKIGKFEIASDGILFLDEISELPPDAQVKILRVLQEKEFNRVGGNATIKTNAKIIAATNKNLEKLVELGKFREDLFYRLDVFPIFVPPLRDRKEDIPLLAKYLIEKNCKEMKTPIKIISKNAIEIMKKYDWRGNIRELENHIIRAIIISQNKTIDIDDLDSKLIKDSDDTINKNIDEKNITPKSWEEMIKMRKKFSEQAKRKVEKKYLEYLLDKFDGNVSQASKSIEINRTNLHKMMKRCGM